MTQGIRMPSSSNPVPAHVAPAHQAHATASELLSEVTPDVKHSHCQPCVINPDPNPAL